MEIKNEPNYRASRDELLKQLEKDGEEMLKKLNADKNVNGETLLNVMKTGEKEFSKRTGRRMTYAEMRKTHG
jgi:hypothetical protein